MNRIWHLPTLIVSFVASLIALKSLDLFMGPDTGDAIIMILCGILFMHVFAFVIGLSLPSGKILIHVILVCIAQLPIGFLVAQSILR